MVSQSVLTVAEVNERLPLVRLIVRDIISLHADVASRRSRLNDIRDRYPSKGSSVYEDEVLQMEDELLQDESRLQGFVGELSQLGGVLVSPEAGVVDFSGEIDGDRVWFCWREGDQSLAFWHAGPCGESDRLPLDTVLCEAGE
ncbi:MAG: DUF2203 domain-containing protein [Planctomycetaceae bacterium]|nr:DUF2203 domain-containing protein [Planctomycetaceae bacterium]